jgi:hypothetical protein
VVCIGVCSFNFSASTEHHPQASVRRSRTTAEDAFVFPMPGGSVVGARALYFRERPDYLGPQAFLGEEIPRPDAVEATPIDSAWRQCTNCADAFAVHHGRQYAICPSCLRLTRLGP